MLNVNELEQRWIRYKVKSFIPYIVIILSIIFIVTALFFFLTPKENTTAETKKLTIQKEQQKISPQKQFFTNKQVKQQPEKEKTIIPVSVPKKELPIEVPKQQIKQEVKRQTKQESKHLLQPSMGFLDHFEETYTPNKPQKTLATLKKKTPIQKVTPKKVKRTQVTPLELPNEEYATPSQQEIVPTEKKDEKKLSITIKRRESESDIKEVISRFQKNNNPALSLFAAKKYYELGNYKQAYNYALVTNKINNDIEESWLVFAKALVKLGKKDQAVKTLRQYINYSHSSNAQILLDEIQRGKFK